MPLISVLVPIYNVEKYLVQCLDSIVGQTLEDIEIICINDGSTDKSLEIIQSYSSRDGRIKIINKKNTGYGNSMNMGLDMAKGEYIGIVESDDFAELDMFQTLYEVAKKNNLDVTRSNFYYYTSKTESNVKSNISYVPHNKVLKPELERSVFYQQPSIWANIYNTKFLRTNGIRFLETPGASYQDTAFSFKVYACAERFMIIDNAFIHYRINEGSSSFQNNTKIYCVCDEYKEIWEYVRSHGLYEKYRKLVPHLQYNAYKWNYNRLVNPCDAEFLLRWQDEFKSLMERGDLPEHEYSPSEYYDICELINHGRMIKNGQPRISIIVPIYNMEKYLSKCLDSLLAQTIKDIEIICVNDGSTDSSRLILEQYSEKDGRIIIVDKPNGGLSSARNAGLKLAKADFIGFVDSDDWVESDTYKSALRNIYRADIVIFGTNVVGNSMMERRKADMEYYRVKYHGLQTLTDDMRIRTDVAAWNKLYRKQIIDDNDIKFPEGLLYEDYSFYWQYIFKSKTAFFDQTLRYNYLRRDGSIMSETFNGSARAIEHLEIFDGVYRYMALNGLVDDHTQTLKSMFLNCFWFAYQNVPENQKKKVLRAGMDCVKNTELSGDDVIDALRNGEFYRINEFRQMNIFAKIMFKMMYATERLTKCNFSTLRKMLRNVDRPPHDQTNAAATTSWINAHEDLYCMERWKVLYDANWADSKMAGGLTSSEPIPMDILSDPIQKGCEYRILITLWGVESAMVQGSVHSDRVIWSASFFDGASVFFASMDCDLCNNLLRVRAINIRDNCDCSKACKVLRIEKRV